jgi:hypothetical protein
MRACLSSALAQVEPHRYNFELDGGENYWGGKRGVRIDWKGGGEGRWREKNVHDVSGFDYQAPARPDQTCGCQGGVLCEGELFGGAVEVGDTGEDEAPLLHRSVSICLCEIGRV